MDPNDLNFNGVAIKEIMNNEGIEVTAEVNYMVDNPGDNRLGLYNPKITRSHTDNSTIEQWRGWVNRIFSAV